MGQGRASLSTYYHTYDDEGSENRLFLFHIAPPSGPDVFLLLSHSVEYRNRYQELVLVLHRHRERTEQVVRKLRIGKLEVALVVELEQGRRVGVLLLQVQVVDLRFVRRVATLLADVHLRAPLLVRVLVLDAVHLQAVRLQRAPLRKGFLAQIALVRPDAGVRPGVPLQVERIVESLAAEGAQVALDVGVALHVPIK